MPVPKKKKKTPPWARPIGLHGLETHSRVWAMKLELYAKRMIDPEKYPGWPSQGQKIQPVLLSKVPKIKAVFKLKADVIHFEKKKKKKVTMSYDGNSFFSFSNFVLFIITIPGGFQEVPTN